MKKHARDFIKTIDKNDVQTILLSGSVSRGDYCPGIKGGMIDLTVMKKHGSEMTAESLFGKNEKPHIPYHCIPWKGEWFAILFTDFLDNGIFTTCVQESRKFALVESKILYDEDDKYKNELNLIKNLLHAFACEAERAGAARFVGSVRYGFYVGLIPIQF